MSVVRCVDRCRVLSGMESRGFHGEPARGAGLAPPRAPPAETRPEIIPVDNLLEPPSRYGRPDHVVVIIRGPPGAGKTYVSKLLKVTFSVVVFMSVC